MTAARMYPTFGRLEVRQGKPLTLSSAFGRLDSHTCATLAVRWAQRLCATRGDGPWTTRLEVAAANLADGHQHYIEEWVTDLNRFGGSKELGGDPFEAYRSAVCAYLQWAIEPRSAGDVASYAVNVGHCAFKCGTCRASLWGEVLAHFDIGGPALEIAAVLATDWDGSLDELLSAATTLTRTARP